MLPALAALLEEHELSADHPAAVQAQADAWAADPGIDDPALVDLTHLPFCSIDELTSKDLDQALFIEPVRGDGGVAWRVWYALADASWFVRAGTALWDEALRRGSSYYLPGLVAPMLPRVLSEDLCSLNPKVDRRALVFCVGLDARGRVIDTRIQRARVHSRAKLTYDGVQAWFDGAPEPCADAAVLQSLRDLATVGSLRIDLADERDVVRFRRQEVVVKLEHGTSTFVAFTDLRNDVERYNEQISLLCNMEGARFLQAERDPALVQPIYRVHDPPAAERLAAFQTQVKGMVAAHGLGSEWTWDPQAESLAAYLARMPSDRLGRAVHRQAIMTSGRAVHTDAAGMHHGVGADVYARFTAPMREIVGVFLHEEAFERLAGHAMATPAGTPDDNALREQVMAAANRSGTVQKALDRAANRLVLDQIFAQDLAADKGRRPQRRGTVMGFSRRKVHVQLDDPGIDVKLYLHHLEQALGQRLRVAEDGCSLSQTKGQGFTLALGDAVDIRVVGEDKTADRWQLTATRINEG